MGCRALVLISITCVAITDPALAAKPARRAHGAKPRSPKADDARPAAQPTAEPPTPAPVAPKAAPQPAPTADDKAAADAMAKGAALEDALGAEPGGQTSQPTVSDPTASRRARRVAVYDLKLQAIDQVVGAVVADSLLAELRKLLGVSAIGMDEIRDMLAFEKAKDQAGCDDVTCLAEIGGALGADDLITGKLSKVGDGHVMLVRRIDQRHAKLLSAFDQRLAPGDGEEFLAAVGPAVEKLFPEQPLREGAKRGVSDEVLMRLHPPPLPRWSTLTAGGGALAGLGVAGVYGLLANSAKNEYHDYARLGTTQVIDGRQLVKKGAVAQSNARMANTFLIAGGALALTAGVMSLFTDWRGYGAAPAPATH